MRTRSQGRASSPQRPVSLASPDKRRKRRASLIDSGLENEQSSCTGGDLEAAPAQEPSTPSGQKTTKRVRFSDLGPELMSSTGLTPFVRRATLSPTKSMPKRMPSPRERRRFSLPPSLPSSNANALPSIEEVQFTPLRQVLGDRIRRRLRRSHLSEELNDMESEQRSASRARFELLQLREEGARKEETIKQLLLDLELQRQLGIEVNAEEEQAIANLKSELQVLKEASGLSTNVSDGHGEGSTAYDGGAMEDGPDSPWEEETFFSSPIREFGPVVESDLATVKTLLETGRNDVSCQASLPDHSHAEEIQNFENAVRRLTKESNDAKAALDMIWTELKNLGFATGVDSKEDMLVALRDSFRESRLQLEYMLPGETSGGTNEGSLLLKSMVEHIRKLLAKQQQDKKTVDRQQQLEAALRKQFNATVQKTADLEHKLSIVEAHRTELIREIGFKGDEVRESEEEIEQKAVEIAECRQRISQLEAEAREQSTSAERLQAALVTYRDEVTSLETLITKMEKEIADKDVGMADLRSEVNVAVAERESMSQTLAKLREEVQESAYELSALAKPGLKENVTRRSQRRVDQSKRDSGISMVDDGEEMQQAEATT